MNADIDLPQLSRQTVGEHLRFDDTDPGRGELPLDEGDQRLEIVGALWHGLLCASYRDVEPRSERSVRLPAASIEEG